MSLPTQSEYTGSTWAFLTENGYIGEIEGVQWRYDYTKLPHISGTIEARIGNKFPLGDDVGSSPVIQGPFTFALVYQRDDMMRKMEIFYAATLLDYASGIRTDSLVHSGRYSFQAVSILNLDNFPSTLETIEARLAEIASIKETLDFTGDIVAEEAGLVLYQGHLNRILGTQGGTASA